MCKIAVMEIDIRKAVSASWLIRRDEDLFRVCIVDESPEMELDPTMFIYRNDEEEPLAMIHLDPNAPCYAEGHIVVRAK